LVRLFVIPLVDGVGRVRRRETLLEKREAGRERPVSPERLLFHWHRFCIYTAALCSSFFQLARLV
jgi:hypothetical protein